MTSHTSHTPPAATERKLTVLLVDDLPASGDFIRECLAGASQLEFQHCLDATKAVEMAAAVRPTVILQSLSLAGFGGLELLQTLRDCPATRDIPRIVLSNAEEAAAQAEAFSLGAHDYLLKWPDRIELIARIRHHSQGYINLLERNEAFAALEASQKRLASEIAAGARYIQSLLPRPMTWPFRIDWRYTPSAELAGDSLGYHWLDSDHLAIYLLDVTGHGLASALLSVTVMNVLRSSALSKTDFRQPGQVLASLNDAFPMDLHGGKCFTIWYGVYHPPTRRLAWSGGGHPPALLLAADSAAPPRQLESTGPLIGMTIWPTFEARECDVPEGSRLYIYSDGAHEIRNAHELVWQFDEFVQFMSQPAAGESPLMDRLLSHIRALHGSDNLDDDFSMIEARL